MPLRKLPSGELQNMVLEILWRGEDWATAGAVHDALAVDRQLAYTTVMTILDRLWRKGVLERRKEGKAFAYRPLQTKDERTAERMNEVLAAAGDHSVALARFVESLGPAQVDQLRNALRRRRAK